MNQRTITLIGLITIFSLILLGLSALRAPDSTKPDEAITYGVYEFTHKGHDYIHVTSGGIIHSVSCPGIH